MNRRQVPGTTAGTLAVDPKLALLIQESQICAFVESHPCAAQGWGPRHFLLSESEKDDEPGICGVCSRGPGERNEVLAPPSMSTINVERVGAAISSGKSWVPRPSPVVTGFCAAIFILRCRWCWRGLCFQASSGPSTRTCFIPPSRGPSFFGFMPRLSLLG